MTKLTLEDTTKTRYILMEVGYKANEYCEASWIIVQLDPTDLAILRCLRGALESAKNLVSHQGYGDLNISMRAAWGTMWVYDTLPECLDKFSGELDAPFIIPEDMHKELEEQIDTGTMHVEGVEVVIMDDYICLNANAKYNGDNFESPNLMPILKDVL